MEQYVHTEKKTRKEKRSNPMSYKITLYTTLGLRLSRTMDTLPDGDLLSRLVNGYITLICTTGEEGEDDIYCDEEGRLKELPPNPFFSSFGENNIELVGNIVRVQKLE